MFDLEPHGPDTFVGTGPRYPWGGLYGGQIVAQALRAAALSVDDGFVPHSIRAYFIRPGDHAEPVRYEVDRIRNGRSFVTRRVVARQAVGAILNAECSMQRDEKSHELQTVTMPATAGPETTTNTSFSAHFDRRWVATADLEGQARDGSGRTAAWMRVVDPVDDDPMLHQAWLAYISDDLPSDAVKAAYGRAFGVSTAGLPGISLDHTIWFHRAMRADAGTCTTWRATSCSVRVGSRSGTSSTKPACTSPPWRRRSCYVPTASRRERAGGGTA